VRERGHDVDAHVPAPVRLQHDVPAHGRAVCLSRAREDKLCRGADGAVVDEDELVLLGVELQRRERR
jgi:hypothetical protein